jgi:hypothetical protein
VMRAACLVVRLVVSMCYVELDVCCCSCGGAGRAGGRPSTTASVPFAVGILL